MKRNSSTHAVSADFERRLIEKLGTGEACPHGNTALMNKPADRRRRGMRPLDEAQPAQRLRVVSVFERRPEAARIPGRAGRASGCDSGCGGSQLRRNVDVESGWKIIAIGATGGKQGLGAELASGFLARRQREPAQSGDQVLLQLGCRPVARARALRLRCATERQTSA